MSELIDRQAAIDVLCDACGNCACPKGKIPRCSYYEKMQAIPAASPWHRVEDELPPKATWVLTVSTEGNVKLFNIATVDAGGQWWTCSPQNILRELYGVRYWMPIEPPKEDA